MKTALLLWTDAVPAWALEGVVCCIAGWPQLSRQSGDVTRRNLTASPVSWLQSFFPQHLAAAAEVWKSATNVLVLAPHTQIVLAEALSEDPQHLQSKTTEIKRKCTFQTKQSTISKHQNTCNSACMISKVVTLNQTSIKTSKILPK